MNKPFAVVVRSVWRGLEYRVVPVGRETPKRIYLNATKPVGRRAHDEYYADSDICARCDTEDAGKALIAQLEAALAPAKAAIVAADEIWHSAVVARGKANLAAEAARKAFWAAVPGDAA